MKKNISITLILLTFLVSTPTKAGPFGMEMGMSLEQVKTKLKLKATKVPGVYETTDLLKSHVKFDDYRLTFSPETGLCKIIAWSVPISSSVYGEGLTSFYESTISSLEDKYGVAKKFDYLNSGSIWNDPKDWMMSLHKKERKLIAYWTNDDSKLSDNINGIALELFASSQDSGIASLTYEFNNITKCHEWKKTKLNDAL